MTLRMCVLLWEQPGRGEDLAEFEDTVLSVVPAHGGTVVARFTVTDRADGDPYEVQILEIPDEQAVASYMNDPARQAVLHRRDEIIARTQILHITPVSLSRALSAGTPNELRADPEQDLYEQMFGVSVARGGCCVIPRAC